MADGKWIEDLAPDMLVSDAARHVLALRLEAVQLAIAQVLEDDDIESVHQLRVATRRGNAVLRIFAACLPSKALKNVRKHLRRVRRSAGEARDWDVLMLDMKEWSNRGRSREQAGMDFLLGYAVARRVDAQHDMEASLPAETEAIQGLLPMLLASVAQPEGIETLLDLARPTLTELLKKLEAAVSGDLEDYRHLHEVRIAGKRLRYAMEVFAPCFGPTFRYEVYPDVEEVQEILGRANDSAVALERLLNLGHEARNRAFGDWKRLRAAIEGLRRYHQRRLPRERKRFQDWWRRWHASGGKDSLLELLGVPMPATS
jgi:CHAD domain-containing protein